MKVPFAKGISAATLLRRIALPHNGELLPKLISGELRVRDAEKFAVKVA